MSSNELHYRGPEQRTPPRWLAASRDEEMVVSAQGRGRRRRPCRGAGSAGSVRALPAFSGRARRLGDGTRSERHPGLRVTRLQIYRGSPLRKRLSEFPAEQGISGKKSYYNRAYS